MYDKTQLMRGSLEGCILKIIEQHMTYGYEILMNMEEAGWIECHRRNAVSDLLTAGKAAL